ncbi:unnamed protein product [Pieris brassicae]|uniref:Uncharacterized protein n=1 Tax=Pieris brassicae TaxID=7116 RepID=A0A9P0TJ34_PIEBR|nr:unnamed protein product [Pieris brassicae]
MPPIKILIQFLFIQNFLLSLLSHWLGPHAWTAGTNIDGMYNKRMNALAMLVDLSEEQDIIELVPNIILNPGFMETDPVRPKEQIVKSAECPGPGKPRRV